MREQFSLDFGPEEGARYLGLFEDALTKSEWARMEAREPSGCELTLYEEYVKLRAEPPEGDMDEAWKRRRHRVLARMLDGAFVRITIEVVEDGA